MVARDIAAVNGKVAGFLAVANDELHQAGVDFGQIGFPQHRGADEFRLPEPTKGRMRVAGAGQLPASA